MQPSLCQIQRQFQRWLENEDEAAAAALTLADTRGLAVYLNNYRGQLMSCLQASFPLTHAWAGDDRFLSAAARHIDKVPPHSWTLDDYAVDYPDSLADDFPYDPEIGELAMLELALETTFVGVDATPLAVEDLGVIDWELAVLRPIPASQMLALHTNAPEIWTALAEELPPPVPTIASNERRVVIWRSDWTCRFRVLADDEALHLERMFSGGIGFAELCKALVRERGEEQGLARAGELLALWVQEGLLSLPTL